MEMLCSKASMKAVYVVSPQIHLRYHLILYINITCYYISVLGLNTCKVDI